MSKMGMLLVITLTTPSLEIHFVESIQSVVLFFIIECVRRFGLALIRSDLVLKTLSLIDSTQQFPTTNSKYVLASH